MIMTQVIIKYNIMYINIINVNNSHRSCDLQILLCIKKTVKFPGLAQNALD